MSLSLDAIKQIAHLARLENTRDGHSLQEDLNSIVKMVDQIQSCNTEGILPMSHPVEAPQRLREDTVTETVDRELFLSLAPKASAGLFIVPPVIE
jgi:aspartyl-tRNA(Asn)/glutamyl-tRNA(Gln) amidotransferase subunit C